MLSLMLCRRLSLLVLLSLALVVAGPQAARAEKPAPPQIAGVVEVMNLAAEEGQISGGVTLVVKDGKTVHLAATGMADIAQDRPMTIDTQFAIASMTKPITATALMILVDQGKVQLTDPVSKYIPEFADAQGPDGKLAQPVTVQHLLTHTSGLGDSQQTETTLEATGKELAQRKLKFLPGSKWQYSPGLNACGRIIEVASGQPYDQFVSEQILQPLKMKHTAFVPKNKNKLAGLYEPGKEKGQLAAADHWLTRFTSGRAPNPSGGLISTAADLARFYQMILNGGELDGQRIVSEEAVKQMTTVQTGDLTTGFTPGNGWGLGWCVVREPQGVSAALAPGSYGHGGAFGTQGWVDPKNQTIYVLLIQRTNFGNSDGSDLRGAFQDAAHAALKN
ncbi:serine hydrolase domain-containing protein [Lignipirellula cremea]|uniref:Esterase EstB n=1 Tax=Lignipirellula cremea TaxID=2528010 RepID=A0A518DXE7_9BACT|nr:serine hydrolase domain-containing protein [Lignipirellula cremea]QDU96494.1 Esterase EstB [Lignipirellula cremea]